MKACGNCKWWGTRQEINKLTYASCQHHNMQVHDNQGVLVAPLTQRIRHCDFWEWVNGRKIVRNKSYDDLRNL